MNDATEFPPERDPNEGRQDAVPVDQRMRELQAKRVTHGGMFGLNNKAGVGKGWKKAIAGMMGRDATDPQVQRVSDDTWRLFAAGIREMPHDGPTVRGMLALKCRHEALAAFWSVKAGEFGLTTPDGIAAQQQASQHGQRAERLAVTAIDISTRLAAAARAKPVDAHKTLLAALKEKP